MKKRLLIIFAAFLLFLTACTSEQDAASTETKEEVKATETEKKEEAAATETAATTAATTEVPESLKKPLQVALVTRFASGAFYTQYSQGIINQVEEFGGKVKVYDSNNDLAKMASNLDLAITEKADAIIVNNGRAEALQAGVEKAIAAGIPVVAYDSDLTTPGVSSIDQDDYLLAWQSLKQMADDLNGQGKIAVLWVAGYNPMERRQVMIDAFKKRYPGIKEVARFGTASANTALDTQAQVEALLKKFPNKGDIDAIYCTWNEFTRGALQALEQAGRTDIKVYGIDLTDEDLQLMLKPNSPWVAASATNPYDLGGVQARLLYKKIAGEQVPDTVQIEPKLIKREVLPDDVKFADLNQYVNGWGKSDLGFAPWMEGLKEGAK